jgi:hypothetical protein
MCTPILTRGIDSRNTRQQDRDPGSTDKSEDECKYDRGRCAEAREPQGQDDSKRRTGGDVLNREPSKSIGEEWWNNAAERQYSVKNGNQILCLRT